jgi:outer membrane protein, heavy metal efflux system
MAGGDHFALLQRTCLDPPHGRNVSTITGNREMLGPARLKCRFLIIMIVFLPLANCASPFSTESRSPIESFKQVAATVDAKLGKEITWDAGQHDNSLVRSTIEKLLSRPLTPETAVAVALLNNRELQSTYADLGIAQANVLQATLWKNPILDGMVTQPYKGGAPDYGFNLAISLVDILYVPLRTSVAESQLEETKLQVTAHVLDLAARAYLAFIDYLSEKQRVGVLAEAVDSARDIVDSGKVRREADNRADYDFEAKVTHQVRAEAELARAQTRVVQARERVNRILGLSGTQIQWRSFERLPSVPAREAVPVRRENQAIEANVDLAVMRQRLVTLARKYQVVNITSLLPQLDVGAMATRVSEVDQAGPSFRAEIPLFDWGQARREAAQMEILKARDELMAIAVRVLSLVRLHQTRLLSTRQTALYYAGNVVPHSRRLFDAAKRKYDEMQLGVFELLQAEEKHVRSSLDYTAALTTYWRERARLAQMLRGGLPEDEEETDAGETPGAQPPQPSQLNTKERPPRVMTFPNGS